MNEYLIIFLGVGGLLVVGLFALWVCWKFTRVRPQNRVETTAIVIDCIFKITKRVSSTGGLLHFYDLTLDIRDFTQPVRAEIIVQRKSSQSGEQQKPFQKGDEIKIAYDKVNPRRMEIVDDDRIDTFRIAKQNTPV